MQTVKLIESIIKNYLLRIVCRAMKAAIMQPSFLPWLGYFALIKSVDKFIFLDDVQFDKRSWQQRNYILSNLQATLLTVPVMTKGRVSQTISEARLDETSQFKRKHINSFQHAYGKAPFKVDALRIIRHSYDKPLPMLADFNIDLITNILSFLGINTELIRSSDLNLGGKKNEKLINICKATNCSQYVTVSGSLDYINEHEFKKNEIELKVFKFVSDKNIIMPNQHSLSAIHYIYEYGLDFFSVLDDVIHISRPRS